MYLWLVCTALLIFDIIMKNLVVYFCSFRLCCTNMTNNHNTGVLFILIFIAGWRGITDEKEAISAYILLPFTEIRWQQTSMEVEIKPNWSRLELTHSIIVSATEAFCSLRTLNGPTHSRLLHTPQQAGNVWLLPGPEAFVLFKLCCDRS